MVTPEFRDAVQHVTNELQGLRSALSFDNISRAIKTFDGSQANLRNWLNEVEKFAFINRIDDNATREFFRNIQGIVGRKSRSN
jgi:hypothetical protein